MGLTFESNQEATPNASNVSISPRECHAWEQQPGPPGSSPLSLLLRALPGRAPARGWRRAGTRPLALQRLLDGARQKTQL